MEDLVLINNRYKVLKKLGEGGMGAVLLVEDTMRQGQKMALKKVLTKEKSSIIEILRHEFEMLTKLRHPNIAQAYDYGITSDTKENFFTTEYIDGIDLFKGTRDLPLEEIIELFVQACRGFDYVHSRGLVHQDIKPDNILVTTGEGKEGADAKGRLVKIIDFGLIDRENYIKGSVRGTPQFIAPEKLKGEPVDRRSDLYSLGILAFFIITRRLPFAAKSNKALILKHLYEDPPLPSKYKPDIPKKLEDIILKLMSKDPGERFYTAAEIIHALGEVFSKSFPIDTAESLQSYILTGKFVGREKEMDRLKQVFQLIFHQLEEKAVQEEAELKKTQVDMLDSLLLGKGKESEDSHAPSAPFIDTTRAPRWIILKGEMGIGKSRLLREFQYHVQLRGGQVISYQARSDGTGSALEEILDKLLTLASASLLDNPEYMHEFSKFFPHRFQPPSQKDEELSPQEEKLRTQERMGRFILQLSEIHPLIFLLDNAQWLEEMDISTFAYLANLLQQESQKGKNYPVMILGALREENKEGRPIQRLLEESMEKTYLEILSLLPLPQEAM
ncbi:MAG: serine/threonine-protein kinase PknK, partial [Planctomycetota bacterium]